MLLTDGAFKFPAIVLTDRGTTEYNARIFVFDITDINNPKEYIITGKPSGHTDFSSTLWISDKEILVGEIFQRLPYILFQIHFHPATSCANLKHFYKCIQVGIII